MVRITRFVAPLVQSRHSATDQNFKSLHVSFEEYLTSGKLDVSSLQPSYDFKSEEDVDFNKVLPHDVDLLDVACGNDCAFPVEPIPNSKDSSEESSDKEPKPDVSKTDEPSGVEKE